MNLRVAQVRRDARQASRLVKPWERARSLRPALAMADSRRPLGGFRV